MAKKIKTFSGMTFLGKNAQVATIVGATTKKAAAELVNASYNNFNQFWSESGNAIQVELCTKNPGVLFIASRTNTSDFLPYDKETATTRFFTTLDYSGYSNQTKLNGIIADMKKIILEANVAYAKEVRYLTFFADIFGIDPSELASTLSNFNRNRDTENTSLFAHVETLLKMTKDIESFREFTVNSYLEFIEK